MDLLRNAYSIVTDDDEENEKDSHPPHKRAKPEFPSSSSRSFPSVGFEKTQSISTEAPIAGRYISKRERALMASAPQTSNADPPTSTSCSPGSISDLYIRKDIFSSLKSRTEGYTNDANTGCISEKKITTLIGHTKAVNTIQWSKTHPHLLASAGMDSSIYVWNVWNIEQKKVRVLNIHTAAVKDVKWSENGLSLLSCGYDCSSRLVDVEKGLETRVFKEDQVVGVVKFHPNNTNLFLSGGSKGVIRLWDIRTGNAVNQYLRGLGPILDVEFTNDTRQFISSSDESKSNISENSIIVWDVSRQVPLSNQIYVEAYTCLCIRHHPQDPYFVAQSNGSINTKDTKAIVFLGFPSNAVSARMAKKLASGSSDGSIYFYNTKTCQLVNKIKVYEQTCVDVAFHPVISNVIATCSWNGEISVFE